MLAWAAIGKSTDRSGMPLATGGHGGLQAFPPADPTEIGKVLFTVRARVGQD